MKKTRIILFLIVIIMLVTVLLQIDDDLDPRIKTIVMDINSRNEVTSNAYLYLNGISSVEGTSIIKLGQARLREYRFAEKNARNTDSYLYVESSETQQRLQTPAKDSTYYCKLWNKGCLQKITQTSDIWEIETDFRNVILERYKRYIQYTDYRTLTRPTTYERYPEYKYLFHGNRLRTFELLSLAKFTSANTALLYLLEDTRKLRKHLALADNVVYKMILVLLVSNNLDAIVYIKNSYFVTDKIAIPQLNLEERDFALSLKRELTLARNVFTAADRDTELFRVGGNVHPILVRASYKPNMTSNSLWRNYDELLTLSRMEPKEFAKTQLQETRSYISLLNLRNIYGTSLIQLNEKTKYNLYKYVSRLFDLQLKIALTNFVLNDKKDKLINPYSLTDDSEIVDGDKLCLAGANVDYRNLRCIWL